MLGQVKAYKRGWVAEAPKAAFAAATADTNRLVCGDHMVRFEKQPDLSWCVAVPASENVRSINDVSIDIGQEGLRVTFPGMFPQLLNWPPGTGAAQIDACSARFSKRRSELLVTVPSPSEQVTESIDASPRSVEELSCQAPSNAATEIEKSARFQNELQHPSPADVGPVVKPVEASDDVSEVVRRPLPSAVEVARGSQRSWAPGLAQLAAAGATKAPEVDLRPEMLQANALKSREGALDFMNAIKQAANIRSNGNPNAFEEGASQDEPSAMDLAGTWILHSAASIGDAKKVEALLVAGQDANCADETGMSALEKACTGCHIDAVTVLLDHGAKVNGITTSSSTPLHRAVSAGSRAHRLVQLLCARGACCTATDQAGRTPADLSRVMGLEPFSELR